MYKRLILFLILSIVGIFSISAQDDDSALQRIAYVSNEFGHEDIFVMTQAGVSDFRIRLTDELSNEWNPQWSPDGTEILFNSDRAGRNTLYVMNDDGTGIVPLFPDSSANEYAGAWSPDGTQIAFVSDRTGLGHEIFIADRGGENVDQITDLGSITGDPSWSPDGTNLIFWEYNVSGQIQIYRVELEDNAIFPVTFTGELNGAGVWSPQGDYIYYDTQRDETWDIYRVLPNGNSPEPIVEAPGNNGRVTLSPDGQKMAFVSDRGISDEIFIMNVDGTGEQQLTSNQFSDHSPAWQPTIPSRAVEGTSPTPAPSDKGEEEGDNSILGVSVGLSVGGIETRVINIPTLLQEYGISNWHENGFSGEGQRIGIIDTAFSKLNDFIDSTPTLRDVPVRGDMLTYSNSTNPHGTQVIEVIHSVSPSAELFACEYNGTFIDFEACIDWLINVHHVTIINHSAGVPILPLNGTNEWAKKIDDVFGRNVLWVNSAGNFARGYYYDTFSDGSTPDKKHEFVIGSGVNAIRDGLRVEEFGDTAYTGTIILSWENAFGVTVDLDLNIVTESGDVLNRDFGRDSQSTNPTLPSYERVALTDISEPFKIQVVDSGSEDEDEESLPVEFAIFIEYASVEGVDERLPSVVAPADAVSAISVGSINGDDELAIYSSRGQITRDYRKPDLSAPGELILRDGKTEFVGTSASAPVVAGILALVLEANPPDDAIFDTVPGDLFKNYIVDQGSIALGRGIIRLPGAPYRKSDDRIIESDPYTVFPREDGNFIEEVTCPNALPTRLDIDVPGYVSYDLGLALRNGPGATEIERLQLGQRFTVIGGPVCIDNNAWWEIDLDISGVRDGGTGWIAEGQTYYFIAPVNLKRAELQFNLPEFICPNALDPQLEIGGRGEFLASNQEFWRGSSRTRDSHTRANLFRAGDEVHILGGPTCEGRNNDLVRWYVRGVDNGLEGWVAEGDVDTRSIEPLD